MLGQRIGAYQIVSLLGEGGMGHVYAADEVTSSGVKVRRVAIKVLRPEHVADRQMSGRFLNEARTIGIVDHPGVVKIFDIGELPSGAPYIAMELLEGESLRARCQRIGLTHSQSLEIGLQLARTLAAVHAKNIVHRDLKPDNDRPSTELG